jgi:hypothetical protein
LLMCAHGASDALFKPRCIQNELPKYTKLMAY